MGTIEQLLKEIDVIKSECSKENWDGYGAAPVSSESVNFTKDFIKDLATYPILPEPGAHPDGAIGLEWNESGYHIILSISKEGELSFAARLPNGRNKGALKWDGRIPTVIWCLLCDLRDAETIKEK